MDKEEEEEEAQLRRRRSTRKAEGKIRKMLSSLDAVLSARTVFLRQLSKHDIVVNVRRRRRRCLYLLLLVIIVVDVIVLSLLSSFTFMALGSEWVLLFPSRRYFFFSSGIFSLSLFTHIFVQQVCL